LPHGSLKAGQMSLLGLKRDKGSAAAGQIVRVVAGMFGPYRRREMILLGREFARRGARVDPRRVKTLPAIGESQPMCA